MTTVGIVLAAEALVGFGVAWAATAWVRSWARTRPAQGD